MKMLFAAVAMLPLIAGGCMTAPAAEAPMAATAMAMPEVTIYHLEGRRSERIVWLMEELGLPYKLQLKRGDLVGSFASIKSINPGMPVGSTVNYGDEVIV